MCLRELQCRDGGVVLPSQLGDVALLVLQLNSQQLDALIHHRLVLLTRDFEVLKLLLVLLVTLLQIVVSHG